jgi:hypothetical protein
MPLLQLLLAATGVVTLIVICHRRGFRGDSPGMDLATTPAMGARNSSLAKERAGTAALSADMGRRMNPIRAGSAVSITMCWIGLARKVSQNQTEPFSLRRTCCWSAVITRGVPCLLGLAMEAKILPKREPSVQHVEGSLKAPRRQQLLGPHQRARKSQGLRGTSVSG